VECTIPSTGSKPVVCLRYNIGSDSEDCYVKLFATRSIKPVVANNRNIARVHALLARVKQKNDVSIS